MEIVSVGLQYTQGHRYGIWEFHLHSFKNILPCFKRYDHINHARWGYLLEFI